ncbi:helix-turn-helix transcriptional regulator [Treponema zuelzerae]|uniref:Helix-turn-helix transcriptional regulator n=1 Tax=Teretinema zuelzerae TaxID=156 RepID=A0AAE3JH38_9SPIR|nr:helix-turn-helix transcriptional regulator [Teretinema zuelzerae]MCD1653172.1 helix-turn-helix transcriptional regulator [Teretinema zuelzerae]
MAIVKDAMKAMESTMTEESISRSNEIYEKELLLINLAELREKYNVKQSEIKGFSQPAVSRIEGRTDIKLSTLIKYLSQLDLDMEIKVRPRNPKNNGPKEVLLFHT